MSSVASAGGRDTRRWPGRSTAAWRTSERYARINVPVTLVYGDEDWSRPSDRQANVESVPGARDLVLRETGHFAALEAPDEVARILLEDGR
jgi:pimeloyl-ACP methyl ester carboxylesterase